MHCLDDEPGVHRVWVPHREAPGLAMSRAFGDYCVKDYGVISAPEVTQRRITARDQFVVMPGHRRGKRQILAQSQSIFMMCPNDYGPYIENDLMVRRMHYFII